MSISYEKIAEVRAKTGDVTEAVLFSQQSLAIREALSAPDAINAQFRSDLFQPLHRVAALSAQSGSLDAARAYTRRLCALQKEHADRATATAADLHAYAQTLLTCEPPDLQDPAAALRYA